MREYLAEGDLVVAEIQSISSRDKSIELHIKSDKYGKLDQGLLVKVSHNLVKRQKVHYIELNIGVVIIFAMNGQFWLMPAPGKNSSKEMHETIAKLKNLLEILNEKFVGIKSELLLDLFEKCNNISAKALLDEEVRGKIVNEMARYLEQRPPKDIISLMKSNPNVSDL